MGNVTGLYDQPDTDSTDLGFVFKPNEMAFSYHYRDAIFNMLPTKYPDSLIVAEWA